MLRAPCSGVSARDPRFPRLPGTNVKKKTQYNAPAKLTVLYIIKITRHLLLRLQKGLYLLFIIMYVIFVY